MAKVTKPRRKHVPIRTCIACRQPQGKRELIRVVRTPSGAVQLDPTGKAAGRGAYLCKSKACWDQALRSQKLSLALKTTVSPEDLAALRNYAETLPAPTTAEA